jgi:hypothetical protein
MKHVFGGFYISLPILVWISHDHLISELAGLVCTVPELVVHGSIRDRSYIAKKRLWVFDFTGSIGFDTSPRDSSSLIRTRHFQGASSSQSQNSNRKQIVLSIPPSAWMEREREEETRFTRHSSCHAQCSYLPTKKKRHRVSLTSRYLDEKSRSYGYLGNLKQPTIL